MLKSRLRITSCFLWVSLTLLGFYSPSPASAETYSVTQQNRDFYFVTQEPMTMTIRTYAQQYGIDSMLWVYDGERIITANDDYYGLDSYVSFEMVSGVSYRLRAGICCGNPDYWYGESYVIEPSMVPTNAPIVETTTTTEVTTTTETPTTTTSTTTTTQPPTTTTSSTTSTTTSTTSSSTTTSTTQPSTTTSLVATTTLPVLVVDPSSTSTTLAPVVSSVAPTTTQNPTTTTTTSISTSTLPVISSTTTIPVITESLSTKDAILLVTSASIVQSLSSDEAVKVFDAVEVSELTNEQATQLIEAVQDAPEEVRAAFEQEVNVFDNKFNKYVPIGSTINIGQRKVLVAATGVLFMAPTVSVSSSTSGSQSDSRKRR